MVEHFSSEHERWQEDASRMCWLDESGKEHSMADFQRLIPKLCALGLHVIELDPGEDIHCPFTIDWEEPLASLDDETKQHWPRMVHHPPTGPLALW